MMKWWTQIKEDFYKEINYIYISVQQKIDQSVKVKKKKQNKEVFGMFNRVAVRDDKWTRTFNDKLNIYKHYKNESLCKKQKLLIAQKNKKDNK